MNHQCVNLGRLPGTPWEIAVKEKMSAVSLVGGEILINLIFAVSTLVLLDFPIGIVRDFVVGGLVKLSGRAVCKAMP